MKPSRAPLPELSFRRAAAEDAPFITDLINGAYRGDSSRRGWTTEADLLEGPRTTVDEVRGLIERERSMVLLCVRDGEIAGCVHLQDVGGTGYLGMFVVRPDLQGMGIGKRFLAEAERGARTQWRVAKMSMYVITLRDELIAFYERRGYRRTGRTMPFPAQAASVPKIQALQFEVLEKDLRTETG